MKRILLIISAGIILFFFFLYFIPTQVSIVTVIVRNGTSFSQVASELKEKDIIGSKTLFSLYVRIFGNEGKIRAGVYEIQKGEQYGEILEVLTSGKSKQVKFTIPEGYTIRQIDTLLAEKGFIEKGEFEKCAKETCKGKNLEGFLFPDTYFIDYGSFSVESFTDLLLNTFDKKVSHELKDDILKSGRTIQEIVIMASILEKEVRHEEDLAIVSGILWKRYDADWGLQVDATLLYDKQDREISAKDLDENSPYNTRKFRGLPPTPIGNPGLKTIKAVTHPKVSEYWFYLSKSDGKMIYAKTNEAHNQNKALYLK